MYQQATSEFRWHLVRYSLLFCVLSIDQWAGFANLLNVGDRLYLESSTTVSVPFPNNRLFHH